ncbi:MAG: hypothetical protein ACJA2J_001441 [Candidatus Azotimanducaceae bacterium]
MQQLADRFRGVDLNIIKVGVYGPSDACYDIHFDPEHAVEAYDMLGRKRMLAVYWAVFTIGSHDWDEPTKRH